MVVFCMAACGGTSELNKEDGKIKIVATIFPEYDWVKTVMGDKAEGADITLLLDNGVDLHSYQPTAEDILKISTCDMFIYVGGESDEWVEDALATAQNKDICVINLMEVLGENVKEEETVEGMQGEKEGIEGLIGDKEEKVHDHEDGDDPAPYLRHHGNPRRDLCHSDYRCRCSR